MCLKLFHPYYNIYYVKSSSSLLDLVSSCYVYLLLYFIIYRAYHRTRELADSIQAKLDNYKAENKDLGRSQSVSELIILDRGFDIISPLLHELTYQVINCW